MEAQVEFYVVSENNLDIPIFLNIKNFREDANIVLNADVHQGRLDVIVDNNKGGKL